jgi:hypothetical protein
LGRSLRQIGINFFQVSEFQTTNGRLEIEPTQEISQASAIQALLRDIDLLQREQHIYGGPHACQLVFKCAQRNVSMTLLHPAS